MEALAKFNPLMILRYSATHKTEHNKVYRLDALDAYNQKLVKKIAVRGISREGFAGTNAYLYLESIEDLEDKPPVARVEMEIQPRRGESSASFGSSGRNDNLFDMSGGAGSVQEASSSREIDALDNTVELHQRRRAPRRAKPPAT